MQSFGPLSYCDRKENTVKIAMLGTAKFSRPEVDRVIASLTPADTVLFHASGAMSSYASVRLRRRGIPIQWRYTSFLPNQRKRQRERYRQILKEADITYLFWDGVGNLHQNVVSEALSNGCQLKVLTGEIR